MRTKQIYTERIHHLNCTHCSLSTNTNDMSHEMTKKEAAKAFEGEGWIYLKGKGWFCPSCKVSVK